MPNTNEVVNPAPRDVIDFQNTEIAFSARSNKELKKMYQLFSLMNKGWLVNIGSKLGLMAIKLRLPFVETILRKTIFEHFCGGESLLDCQPDIDTLNKYHSLTILDYGAEGKTEEEDLDFVMEETIRAIEFAASNSSVPVVSTKMTGMVANVVLEKMHAGEKLSPAEAEAYEKLRNRMHKIGTRAAELGVGVFIDAEESWMQDPIDQLVDELMEKYNVANAIIYNTYQMYLSSKLAQLKKDHQKALDKGYLLGAKLVRGAYMIKEKERAEELGYPSPVQPNKAATDQDFDAGVEYCVTNFETIASCCASHNQLSNSKQAQLIATLGIPKNHPHLNFCQLYGMSDNITFNIGNAGYNVAKYMPYGPIRDVVPYLIRRAQENSSVTGEMSRELSLIAEEKKRRGI